MDLNRDVPGMSDRCQTVAAELLARALATAANAASVAIKASSMSASV